MMPVMADERARDAGPETGPVDEISALRARVQDLTAQLTATPPSRGRFALELDAATSPQARDAARQRARADRAEAALADTRRDAARAILGLRRRALYWQLVAQGHSPTEAAAKAGLGEPLDTPDEPPAARVD